MYSHPMSNKTIPMTDALYEYSLENWLREPELFRQLREETAALPEAQMQISPDQGQLMFVLTKLIGARRALEIGTFTGYSSLAVASALPVDGELVACDVSEEFTAVARRYWEKAGLSGKVRLILAPATETLGKLLAEGGRGSFDMAFIDADKSAYPDYFDSVVQLVRPGGMILIDNVLRHGTVADPADIDAATVEMREFNRKVLEDARVDIALLPIADGLTICRVK
jgi:predicted O-methyltransferase YrrM